MDGRIWQLTSLKTFVRVADFCTMVEYALYPTMIEVISTWDLENILFHKWNISKLDCEGDNE
jgi:hypothetical protein